MSNGLYDKNQYPKALSMGKLVMVGGDAFFLTIPSKSLLADINAAISDFYRRPGGTAPDSLTYMMNIVEGRNAVSFHRGFDISSLLTCVEGRSTPLMDNAYSVVPWQPMLIPLDREGQIDWAWAKDNPIGTICKGGIAMVQDAYCGQPEGVADIPAFDSKGPSEDLTILDLESGLPEPVQEIEWISVGYGMISSLPIAQIPMAFAYLQNCVPIPF